MTTPETQAVSTTSETTGASTCGRVKWFNNRAGYGFITVSSGDNIKARRCIRPSLSYSGRERAVSVFSSGRVCRF